MRTIALALAPLVCLAVSEATAQTATATGVGVGVANSKSQSNAVAISGQGGAGGSSAINIAAQPVATVATVNNTGTVTERNVPAVFAPGLAAAGLETCLGSVSGGGSVVGTGLSFGTTVPDPGCAARLDARTLWSFGLKKAALARLCLTPDIYRSMPEVCAMYMPVQYAAAPVAAPAFWQTSETLPPPVANAYNGGPIELIEGRTGKPRLCDRYDAVKHRCKAWAHIP